MKYENSLVFWYIFHCDNVMFSIFNFIKCIQKLLRTVKYDLSMSMDPIVEEAESELMIYGYLFMNNHW